MSLGLYVDEHVPAAITEGLQIRGVDVLTVQGDHRERVDDDALILQRLSLQLARAHEARERHGAGALHVVVERRR